MSKKHIAVLMGGVSSEREVSLASGSACVSALKQLGYRVSEIDVSYDVSNVLKNLKPDIALNVLHGSFGEDGRIQGILEYLRIPYTHSGVLASALAMNKAYAKTIVSASGVRVASSFVMRKEELLKKPPMSPPYVIKPIYGGSSCGVILIRNETENVSKFLSDTEGKDGDEVLVEQYISGRELSCAVMGDRSLGICEIILPQDSFYDFEIKYKENLSQHICPAKILPNVYQKVERMAVQAHKALGCRGVSRSDFRFDESGTGDLIWLELNSQPGMTISSLLPDIARAAGYSFNELIEWIVEDASCMR